MTDQIALAARPPRQIARSAAVAGTTAAAIVALIAYRNNRLFVGPEFWAEDIVNYFIDDRLFGSSALLMPHNGFVQLCCRLVAWLVGFADPVFAPRLYTVFFLAAVALAAVLVFTSPIFHDGAKPLAALALAAAPVNSEIFYGMCYMPWVLGPLVGLALCERPSGRRAGVLLGCAALLGASSPFLLVAAPLIALKIAAERSAYAKALLAVAVVTAPIHLQPIIERFTAAAANGPILIKLDAIASISYRWFVGGQPVSDAVSIIIGLATLAAFGFMFASARSERQPAALYCAGLALLLLFVSCWSIGADRINQFGFGARYFYIPTVFLLWSIVIMLQSNPRARGFAIGGALVCGALFVAHADRAGAHFETTNWRQTAMCLHREEVCAAKINPNWLGRWRIPSDLQISTMTAAGAVSFNRFPADW